MMIWFLDLITIKYLGAWLDQHLSFKSHIKKKMSNDHDELTKDKSNTSHVISRSIKTHIKKKCQTAMMNLQRIKAIHHMLSQEACHQLILGLVISHLDYVNAILINLPQREIHKLQRIQNMAAKIVLGKKQI